MPTRISTGIGQPPLIPYFYMIPVDCKINTLCNIPSKEQFKKHLNAIDSHMEAMLPVHRLSPTQQWERNGTQTRTKESFSLNIAVTVVGEKALIQMKRRSLEKK